MLVIRMFPGFMGMIAIYILLLLGLLDVPSRSARGS